MKKQFIILFFLFSISSTGKGQAPSDTNLVEKEEWSISFVKGLNWNMTTNANDEIILTQTSGLSTGDIITIVPAYGVTVMDSDNKFGSVAYFYDNDKQMWMTLLEEDENIPSGITPKPAKAETKTSDGMLVFRGTGRWLTLIIPLSHTRFIKLKISGGGETKSLVDLAKSIRKI